MQNRMPLVEAMLKYKNEKVYPFHTPGHKGGRGMEALLKNELGAGAVAMDVSLMSELDDIHAPSSYIMEAQNLAAQLYGSDRCFFAVNGTTGAIHAMLMAACKAGDKILVPRNAHRSVAGALLLANLEPVFAMPEYDAVFGINTQITPQAVEAMFTRHADIKAVLVTSPNYYGQAADLKAIAGIAHAHNAALLVDEAHNLVERGREMYSARLVKEDFLAVKKIVKAMERHEKRPEVHYILRKFEKSLEAANRVLLAWKKECDEFEVISDAGTLEFALLRVAGDYELVAKEYPVLPECDTILSLYFDVRRFLTVLEKFDESDRIYLDYDEERKFRIKIQCMDPSGCLKEVMERVQSTIFFSATLLPIRYYKEQLGGEKEDAAVYAKSVFLPEQRKVMIARDVTTKYTRRGAAEYEKIVAYIDSFISAKEGNYLLFFPSYRFMDEIVTRLPNRENQKILVQMPEMREREREEFLEAFSEETDKSVIGCCVMGGIFSEGIDLKEECLIGAVVVGTGIPMVCHERELFKDYYEEKKGDGFSYAYLYPAVNKVFQAGGRVIRTINDKGAILLLDERFMQKQYQDLFPREWYPFDVVNCEKMKELLAEFWQE